MANLVLNYSANVYQKKLNALEGYASQLNTHLSSLESLRDRLPDVWDDDQSAEYYNLKVGKPTLKSPAAGDSSNPQQLQE
ncbi:MAG: hypothetical protein LUF35_07525, partial [Lachnospiraceae bacterium]|nr:hypothetical protein [Lachnospiraceae bacterium]